MNLGGAAQVTGKRMRLVQGICLALALLLLHGCATVASPDPRDPMESFNRSMFNFNDGLDRVVLKPVAQTYQAVLPQWMRSGIHNFLGNLDDVWYGLNNALQNRRPEAGDSIGRVMINSTIGLLGFIDVASDLGIDKHPAKFGGTLGKWGVPPGPYVVLPLIQPAGTLRDAVAWPVDYEEKVTSHIKDATTSNSLFVLDIVDSRATYLQAEGVVNGAALDRYSFFRDAYLQRQRNADYDGDPPMDDGAEQ